ncbi:hypothetical protein QFZ81_003974 [Paenibacillus sp. V4I9]|nr:hypothetical protein [Paenibacillus sp. V4I9]
MGSEWQAVPLERMREQKVLIILLILDTGS